MSLEAYENNVIVNERPSTRLHNRMENIFEPISRSKETHHNARSVTEYFVSSKE